MCVLVDPAFGRMKKDGCYEFSASLSYRVTLCLRKKKKKRKKKRKEKGKKEKKERKRKKENISSNNMHKDASAEKGTCCQPNLTIPCIVEGEN